MMLSQPKVLDVVAAVINDGARYLACRRAPERDAGGRWEFPGGKVERGETAQQALTREIREELGADIEVGDLVTSSQTSQAGRVIDIRFYRAQFTGTIPTGSVAHDELVWLPAAELNTLDWAVPDLSAVGQLQWREALALTGARPQN
jgi:8-oxo-dGTP diphosphatase